jgi:hypothetical protein
MYTLLAVPHSGKTVLVAKFRRTAPGGSCAWVSNSWIARAWAKESAVWIARRFRHRAAGIGNGCSAGTGVHHSLLKGALAGNHRQPSGSKVCSPQWKLQGGTEDPRLRCRSLSRWFWSGRRCPLAGSPGAGETQWNIGWPESVLRRVQTGIVPAIEPQSTTRSRLKMARTISSFITHKHSRRRVQVAQQRPDG